MTEISLQTVDGYLAQAGPVEGHRLHLVVEERGGAVGIDEGDVLLAGTLHHVAQGIIATITLRRRTGDMVGIVADSSLDEGPCV